MEPSLSHGDFVLYSKISNDSSSSLEGKIVVIKSPIKGEKLIIKRVFKETLYGIDVRGDNSGESTDSRQFGLLAKSQLYGIIENKISSLTSKKKSS